MDCLQLRPQLQPKPGIQVRQRLIQQKSLRAPHQRPPDGDALPLPARQRLRPAPEQLLYAEQLGRGAHASLNLGALGAGGTVTCRRYQPRQRVAPTGVPAPQHQAECHVAGHGQVRIESVVLEDNGQIAVSGRQVVDDARADADRAGGQVLKARDQTQRRALAAAGWTDQHDELAFADCQVEAIHGSNPAGVNFRDVVEYYLAHRGGDYNWAGACEAWGRPLRPGGGARGVRAAA